MSCATASMLAEYEHPSFGTVRSVGLPVTMSEFAPSYAAGPALGADGDAILGEIGYDDAAIARLRAEGAFGPEPGAAGAGLARRLEPA